MANLRDSVTRWAGIFIVGVLVFAASAEAKMKIFDGQARTLIVNGYSTSFKWPAVLQTRLDRYAGGKSPIRVVPATKGGTPIAKWLDVPKRTVQVTQGAKSRVKSLTVSGKIDCLEARLSAKLMKAG